MNRKLRKLINNPRAYFADYLRKKVRNSPNNPVSLVARAILSDAREDFGYGEEILSYLKAGKSGLAEDVCTEALNIFPHAIKIYAAYAEVSMFKKEFDEAARRWETVIQKFHNEPEGYEGLAKLFMSREDYANAETICKEAMDRFHKELWPFRQFAEISMRLRNFPEALKRWKAVRQRFSDKAVGYAMAAAAQRELKGYKDAEALCRQGMEVEPKYIRSFVEYAEISMSKCDFNQAANRWEIVRDKFPNHAEGYLGGARAYMEMHEYAKAEDVCKLGIRVMERQPGRCRDLYYHLIDITMRQHGRAKDCIEYLSCIEQTHQGAITERRHYVALAKILLFMLGRDKEVVHSPNTDFLVVRLLKEPLYYTHLTLGLNVLLYRDRYLSNYKDACKSLKEYIQVIIQKEQMDNPMAVLVSSASSDEDRLNAYLKIIHENCFHSIQLSKYQAENIKMLEKACDAISQSGEWKSLNPYLLFNFVRAASFTNQNKGDKLISEVYKHYGDKNLPVSDPIGLVCYRHKRRQEILGYVSKLPQNSSDELNIAICVSGQLRGYKGNFYELVKALGLGNHNYKVFVHTWRNIGRHFPIPNRAARVFSRDFARTYYECFVNKTESQLKEYIKNQYPNFYSLLLGSSIAVIEELKEEYKTSSIVIEDEEDERFSSWTNQEKMHYKISAAHKLAKNSGENFDLIIRIRPDLKCLFGQTPSLLELYNNSRKNISVFTSGGLYTGPWDNDFAMSDIFAIGVPEAMDVYANTYNDFQWHKENNSYLRTKQFEGHNTLTHNLYCNGIHVDKLEQKTITGTLHDPEKIPTEEVYDAICKDIKNRKVTAEDQRLLDACEREIGPVQNDLERSAV